MVKTIQNNMVIKKMEEFDLEGILILIVEDDPGILMLLRTFFSARGAVIATEKDGRNVLARAKKIKPDLVILDVVMPYVDGLTVLARLREFAESIPVIMLTDKNTIDDKVKGLDLGADDYVTKPFSTKELVARVNSVLRRAGATAKTDGSEKLALGTLSIDFAAREIVYGDCQKLQFTKTEFDLTCYLAKKKHSAVSHSELLKEVMGYKGDVETKALVMHIANMRKKLVKAEIMSLKIETVAGVGYKLTVIE